MKANDSPVQTKKFVHSSTLQKLGVSQCSRSPCFATLGCTLAVWFALGGSSLQAIVISEIHYHPAGGNSAFEFVEVTNESTTPEDISGYHFTDGIVFEFAEGTILGGGETIVVCANANAIQARYGIDNVVGDFVGLLESSGERLTLVNHVGVVVESIRYRQGGKWPHAADGTGHSLILKGLRLDSSEPESWTWSGSPGGSPGRVEAAATGSGFEDHVLFDTGDSWRFARGTDPFDDGSPRWFQPEFDDTAWETGPAGFGYGDSDDETVLDDMRNGYTSVACRQTVALSATDLTAGELTLAIRYDDAFCAFVNGVEFASVGCPDEITHDGLALGGHEANEEESFAVPPELLVLGANTIAIIGYNVTVDSTDYTLAPRVLLRRPVAAQAERLQWNELHRSQGASWAELFNPGSVPVDISGFRVSTDPLGVDGYDLPANTVVPPFGFLMVDGSTSGLSLSGAFVQLFLRDSEGVVVAAELFDRALPPGMPDMDYSEVAFPDGSLEDHWIALEGTPGAANRVEQVTEVVLNEIMYHPPNSRDTGQDRPGEFLEFYNRGAQTVDLSGFRLDRGVDYTMPEGTLLAPGGYLVVASDPDWVESRYDLTGVLGPWVGRLSNSGENVRLVDTLGNLVNAVRYHEGGEWGRWADGGGSSLELIDPFQRNDVGAAWAASDETSKAGWERLSYSASDYVPAGESEFHLFLVGRGTCLIDDVEIRRSGGANHIPNSGFESSTAGWIIEGTHQDTRRTTRDARSGSACLELDAAGKGDSSVNRIEIETQPSLTRGRYDVSLWARWQRGSSVLVAHGEFAGGPWGGRPPPSTNLSGNTLGGRLELTVPEALGSPGERNSVRGALIRETGTGNLGPVIWDVQHSPTTPEADEAVTVTARVSDSDGVADVELLYREGHAEGAFTALPMALRSSVVESRLAGARYQASIPERSAGRKVVFFVRATDTNGTRGQFPVEAPEATLLYQVSTRRNTALDSVSVLLDDRSTTELSSRRLHSNYLLPGTLVFNDDETYYSVGVRYRGSPWGRRERTSYRVRLQRDRRLHPGLAGVNLSARANGPVEAASYYLTSRAGTLANPASVPLYHFVSLSFNGSSRGTQRFIQPVGGDYLDAWFPGSDGSALKAVARLRFDDGGNHTGYDGASFDYMGRNSENYRFYYHHVRNRSRDDWDSFSELMRVMDPSVTSNALHDAEIGGILDVEGFLRVMVPRVFVSDWDTLGIGQGHNAYLVEDSRDGLWETIPFDYNQAMPGNQVDFPVFPTFDPGWARLISRAPTRRVYLRIASEFLDGAWSTEGVAPYLEAMERDVRISMGDVRSFVPARRNVILRAVEDFRTVPFRITTNGGNDITTTSDRVTLEGEAPVQVATLLYLVNGTDPVRSEPIWLTPTRWRLGIDLFVQESRFDFVGVDTAGDSIAFTSIDVSTSADLEPVFVRGDANDDALIEVSDGLAILLYQFGDRPISCTDAADVDDSGEVEVTDAVRLFNYLLLDGPAPAAPFPVAGRDDTADALDCE